MSTKFCISVTCIERVWDRGGNGSPTAVQSLPSDNIMLSFAVGHGRYYCKSCRSDVSWKHVLSPRYRILNSNLFVPFVRFYIFECRLSFYFSDFGVFLLLFFFCGRGTVKFQLFSVAAAEGQWWVLANPQHHHGVPLFSPRKRPRGLFTEVFLFYQKTHGSASNLCNSNKISNYYKYICIYIYFARSKSFLTMSTTDPVSNVENYLNKKIFKLLSQIL